MTRYLLFSVAVLAALSFSAPSYAQETVPGATCDAAEENYIRQTGGPETSGVVHLLICDGANWQQLMEWNATGSRYYTYFGSSPGAGIAGSNNRLYITLDGTTNIAEFTPVGGITGQNSFRIADGTNLGFGPAGTHPRTVIVNDGTGRLAIKRSDTSDNSELRIYKTNGDETTNREYASMGWFQNSNVFTIQTEATGSGTVHPIALMGGNVGIGTEAPNSMLEIEGNNPVVNIVTQSTNDPAITFSVAGTAYSAIGIKASSGDFAIDYDLQDIGTTNFVLGTNGNERLLVDNAGRVGIGTSDPKTTLDVAGEIKVGTSTGLDCDADREGGLRWNASTPCVEFCDGGGVWSCISSPNCVDVTPDTINFADNASASASTLTTSNILQITGLACTVNVTISGEGSPEYRICTDGSSEANCDGSLVQDWTSNATQVSNNDYMQLRLNSSAAGGDTRTANLTVGGAMDSWNVTPSGDCTGGTPAPGTVCADGTVYVGKTPDGAVKMFAQRCDAGMVWDGAKCSGARAGFSWNDGEEGPCVRAERCTVISLPRPHGSGRWWPGGH